MVRDPAMVPYRASREYARACVAAALQRARIRHRVRELWTDGVGQSTSAVVRRAMRAPA